MSTPNSTTCAPPREATISTEQMAEHEGLVGWVVRRQWLGGLPFDDAVHEGRIGLWAAIRGYDPQRGTTFSTYAVPAITRAVWRAVAVHSRLSSSPLFSDVPSEATDLVDEIHDAQVRSALLDLVGHLPPRLGEIIVARYGFGRSLPQTFAAIGHTMGISRQRVHQLHTAAILWLAHPAHSLTLRRLLERNRRSDYHQTLARHHKAGRAGRARRAKR
ncbi:MAG: sigma-70 family RNA polymerase sigma factor [Chloroflexi bacterium]|nr:sigma-70 family RNA polymerase sigma factor [Chloroflexota bacterium]